MALPTNWVNNIGMQVDADFLNQLGTEVNANTSARALADTYANRPAAGSVTSGTMFYCTDCDAVYRSSGGSWVKLRVAGRAGGPLADPPSSGLTTTPMGSATFTSDRDARLLTIPSDDSWHAEYKALSPTSNYTATAYIEIPDPGASAFVSGITLLGSSGTSIIGFGPGSNGTFGVFVFGNTVLSDISTTIGSATSLIGSPSWYRVRDDGTNRNFEYSLNGIDWKLVVSQGRTAFLTPAYIGWGGINKSGTARTARLRSFVVA